LFTRNGQNLVFVSNKLDAVWVTFRPAPGKAKRSDKLDCWECALFRNEGDVLSSHLIKEAHSLSIAIWGQPPPDGFITFVKPDKIRSSNPGCCYKKAGWTADGVSKSGLPRFRAPELHGVCSLINWSYRGKRGGKLRKELESNGVILRETIVHFTDFPERKPL
jgi:hypothetical protein